MTICAKKIPIQNLQTTTNHTLKYVEKEANLPPSQERSITDARALLVAKEKLTFVLLFESFHQWRSPVTARQQSGAGNVFIRVCLPICPQQGSQYRHVPTC